MFAFETSLLIPLGDNVFCIVCLLCVLPPEVDQQRKSLRNCSTRPESKVNSYPVFCAFFLSVLPATSLLSFLLPEKKTKHSYICFIAVLLFACCGFFNLDRPFSLSLSLSISTVKGDHAAKHALFSHGVCNWPGCESVCENFSQFIK